MNFPDWRPAQPSRVGRVLLVMADAILTHTNVYGLANPQPYYERQCRQSGSIIIGTTLTELAVDAAIPGPPYYGTITIDNATIDVTCNAIAGGASLSPISIGTSIVIPNNMKNGEFAYATLQRGENHRFIVPSVSYTGSLIVSPLKVGFQLIASFYNANITYLYSLIFHVWQSS